MSISITEKEILYDNPCAPIVKFSHSNNIDDEDMTDDQTSSNIINDTLFHATLEHSFKAFSLEDLVKSFDNTINICFSDQQIIESEKFLPTKQTNLISTSNTWSNLIENLQTSLRNDLKLPYISKNCQLAMNNINEKQQHLEDEFISIDDLNEDEEEELREQLDMHSIIISNNFHHEPFLTAEQVISEIDFMLQDMTPDSGYCDDDDDDLHISCIKNNEFYLKNQSIYSLNELYDELNISIKNLSHILVQELANRDELEYEKETKNTFISLVLSIQNKRRHYQNDKHEKCRTIVGNNNYTEPGTYLTTIIPFDRDHPTYLSVEHLENLNKILHAINEDSVQVTELLTNYILKVLCPY
ncbi:unnamed protein product [Rotaria sordida]|uniref:Uncharacterized protein n=2 Tax=Rotaria sordida TaxID=392033 RepID=A0A818R4X8_9BILA|nr:unnamed protein product [Rotaria sordida]CAF1145335.1 unnamed protein product [Rotaria sordida]CAF3651349.1 unnamed protein product [Rotaria sordida]CAF3653097.1 unnamed protein product [Rotaria sordida]